MNPRLRAALVWVKNPTLELAVCLVIIFLAVCELIQQVRVPDGAGHGAGHAAVAGFGIFWLVGILTNLFDSAKLLDDSAERRWHHRPLKLLHWVAHSPLLELIVGVLLLVVGVAETWKTLQEESGRVDWRIGLTVLGLVVFLRGFTRLLTGLAMIVGDGETSVSRHPWIHFLHDQLQRPRTHILLGSIIVITSILDLILVSREHAGRTVEEEFSGMLVLGLFTVLKAIPDLFSGLGHLETAEEALEARPASRPGK